MIGTAFAMIIACGGAMIATGLACLGFEWQAYMVGVLACLAVFSGGAFDAYRFTSKNGSDR